MFFAVWHSFILNAEHVHWKKEYSFRKHRKISQIKSDCMGRGIRIHQISSAPTECKKTPKNAAAWVLKVEPLAYFVCVCYYSFHVGSNTASPLRLSLRTLFKLHLPCWSFQGTLQSICTVKTAGSCCVNQLFKKCFTLEIFASFFMSFAPSFLVRTHLYSIISCTECHFNLKASFIILTSTSTSYVFSTEWESALWGKIACPSKSIHFNFTHSVQTLSIYKQTL